jgi:hypothetical protein
VCRCAAYAWPTVTLSLLATMETFLSLEAPKRPSSDAGAVHRLEGETDQHIPSNAASSALPGSQAARDRESGMATNRVRRIGPTELAVCVDRATA